MFILWRFSKVTSTSGRAQNLKKKCELCFGRFRCMYIIFAEFNYWNVVLHTFRLWNRPNTMNEILSSWLPPVDVFQQHMFLCVWNTYDFDKKVDYTKNIQPSVALIICNYGTWIFLFFFSTTISCIWHKNNIHNIRWKNITYPQ